MTTAALYHEFGGLTFGQKPATTTTYELVSADGLEDFGTTGGTVEVGGMDGRGLAPLWLDQGGWVTVVEIYGATTDEWINRRDQLREATTPILDRNGEAPYDMTYGDEDTRTIFARPGKRSIPTDVQYLVKRFAEAQIAFTANDPLTYGPVENNEWDLGDDWTFTPAGWCPSQRWRWIVHGEAHNPRLTLHADGYADQVIRFVGTVNSGQNLLVETTPHGITATVGGFDRFGDFDGGNSNVACPFFAIPPGEVTLSYDGGIGSGDGSFQYRAAML